MGGEFLAATFFNLAINLIYTLVSLLVGVMALRFIDSKLLKNIDIEQELKEGNVAVAIFASTILLFVALIISFGLKS
ncbi:MULTISPECIES: DUF350 domain-containing protein [Corallincola]|uniref:DUF350 domain-containing protein n=3 Tax=Corallincola TaxID=1775176 RepID=A0A368NLT2_9GAMM|nr:MULTISPECIES: DUF350 domain-containing protein [Corallincola]RCU51552.1 DUF350 domain-containing protein [Corallincola holothuriorum]TAA47055.1 DUF350 domain-containing protein [Corallincola spongiicola]TCI04704.1 DUF350 domain-containing protein [Corallincola luteus]